MSADANQGARPRAGEVLARLDDIPEGNAIVRDFREGDDLFSLLLVRKNGAVHAYQNLCPHARQRMETILGAVLIEEGAFIVCAAHGASFAIGDGRCVGGPARGGLTALTIAVRDGDIVAV
jgi:nitrite reductase/ring-hydroxylating ferredoxin subunit